MSILQKSKNFFREQGALLGYIAVFLLPLYSAVLSAQCSTIQANTSTITVGSQAYTGRLGLRFDVNSPIIVSQLGAFDSGVFPDGISGAITIGIVNEAGTVVVPASGVPVSLVGFGGTYVGRFLMTGGFPEVTLTSGRYTVVAFGFSASDPNGNTNFGDNAATVNNGSGIISFVDSRFDDTAAMGLPANSYTIGGFHAGNLLTDQYNLHYQQL